MGTHSMAVRNGITSVSNRTLQGLRKTQQNPAAIGDSAVNRPTATVNDPSHQLERPLPRYDP